MNMKQITFLSVLLALLTSVGETKITTKSFGDLGLEDKVVTGVTIDSGITLDTLKQNIKEAKSETEAKVVSAAKSATNYTDKASAAVLSQAKDYANDVFKTYQPTVEESDPTVPAWAKEKDKPTYTASQVGVTLDGGVITIDGEKITPLVEHQSLEGVTNYVDAATSAVVTSVEKKGYLTSESDPEWRAWTNSECVALGKDAGAMDVTRQGWLAIGYNAKVSDFSTALGNGAYASGDYSTALGKDAYAPAYSLGLAYTPETIYLCSSNTGNTAGSTARSLRSYFDEKADADEIPDVRKFITADDLPDLSPYAKKYTHGGALSAAKDAAFFTTTVAEGASLVIDNLPTDTAYVTDFVVLVNAAADTQLGTVTTTNAILFAGGNLYEAGSIAAGYSLITFTRTDGYWIASLTALEAATTTQE